MQSCHQIATTNKPTPSYYNPDALTVVTPNQQYQSNGGEYHIPWTCPLQAYLGSCQPVLCPLKAPG